jgi:hypothetical protein
MYARRSSAKLKPGFRDGRAPIHKSVPGLCIWVISKGHNYLHLHRRFSIVLVSERLEMLVDSGNCCCTKKPRGFLTGQPLSNFPIARRQGPSVD